MLSSLFSPLEVQGIEALAIGVILSLGCALISHLDTYDPSFKAQAETVADLILSTGVLVCVITFLPQDWAGWFRFVVALLLTEWLMHAKRMGAWSREQTEKKRQSQKRSRRIVDSL